MRPGSSINAVAAVVLAAATLQGAQQQQDEGSFRFRTGVELINVTASVSDGSGRFVSGLREGGLRRLRGRSAAGSHALQRRTSPGQPRDRARHERQHGRREDAGRAKRRSTVPLRPARPEDEIFLYTFSDDPALSRGGRAIGRRCPARSTGFEQMAGRRCTTGLRKRCRSRQSGRHQKKAIILISDGNDTSSRTTARRV